MWYYNKNTKMFYVYIFIVVVNLFSDQSMERQTEPGTIYIGNTELTNSLDLDRLSDILSREKTQLQIQNYRPRSWRGVLYTTLWDKVCKWLAKGLWFSPGTPVSSTNKTNRQDITDIWLMVALNNKTVTTDLQLRKKIIIYSMCIYFVIKCFYCKTRNSHLILDEWIRGSMCLLPQYSSHTWLFLIYYFLSKLKVRRGHDHMVVGFTTNNLSVPITTEVMSYNPAQTRCTRYNNMVQ
jgi:hypothetical protein